MKHVHAEFIKLWADGAEIEYSPEGINVWYPLEEVPMWHPGCRYRVKPAAPKWPQATMDLPKLMAAFEVCSTYGDSLKYVANAVIEHECSTGALVPADKVRDISAEAYAQGAKAALDPVAIIEAVFDHLRAGIADPKSIQVILLRAAK